MNVIQQILVILGGLIVVVSFVGLVAQFLRGSVDKGTIEALQRNNAALIERVEILEDQDKAHEAKETALMARVEALERENTLLLRQRPSAEAIAEIDRKLTDHDDRTMSILQGGA